MALKIRRATPHLGHEYSSKERPWRAATLCELGGIAWSETGPYALLDERVVGLGESIMGYMVTRIAPQEVELEGSDGAILIRLK